MSTKRGKRKKLNKAIPSIPPNATVTTLDPTKLINQVRRAARGAVRDEVRNQISTIRSGNDWLGPQQPVPPQAPTDAAEIRVWDYPVGYNVDWRPRKYTSYTFAQLQWLADNFDLLREVIDRRKDEVSAMSWDIVDVDEADDFSEDAEVQAIKAFFRYPNRQDPWPLWIRGVLEDMYVTDSATIYPRPKVNGEIYAFDYIAGATITPLIDETGRLPEPPDPAYAQVIKGLPYRFFNDVKVLEDGDTVETFTRHELVYFPRNRRPAAPVYGFSQVEQLVMSIAIGIKAEQRSYYWYSEGNIPDSLISTPDNWSSRQIAQFQAYWDSLMAGNLRKRSGGARFVPGGMREIAMKDYKFDREMWEWLARVICAGFHVSPQPYTQMMNRATADTAQVMQIQEGLEPDKEWVAALMTMLIQIGWQRADLKFQWAEDDKEVDVGEQHKADDLDIRNGSQTINELRISRGEQPYSGGVGDKPFILLPNGPVLLEDIEGRSKAGTEAAQNAADPQEPQPSSTPKGAAGAPAKGKQPESEKLKKKSGESDDPITGNEPSRRVKHSPIL